MTVGAIGNNPARSVAAAAPAQTSSGRRIASSARSQRFTARKTSEGGPHVVIISDDFWRQQLGGRADVLGTTISIDGNVHTIIRVMPKCFASYQANLWLPLALPANSPTQGAITTFMVSGRLRKG